jgi:hypothetical protein
MSDPSSAPRQLLAGDSNAAAPEQPAGFAAAAASVASAGVAAVSAAAAAAFRGPSVEVPLAAPDGDGKLPMEFLVVDAERRFDINGKVQNLSFWVFKVLCRARLPEYLQPPLFPPALSTPPGAPAPKHFIVSPDGKFVDYCAYHRYSDFEFLRDRLKADLPGLMLPPIPEKESAGTLDKLEDLVTGKEHERVGENAFAAARMRQLNLFVQALGPLAATHKNAHVRAFVGMCEPQWVEYHASVVKSLERPITETAKSMFAGVRSFFKSVGRTKIPVFDPVHPVSRIQTRLRGIGDAMFLCAKHLEGAAKAAHSPWEARADDGTQAALAKHPLPPPLLFQSHRVASRDHLDGVVLHLDDATGRAFVDWHDGRAPEAVAQNSLFVPASGIVDPVCLLAVQLVGGIDSTLTQLCTRDEAAVLRDAVDHCYFIANWARASAALVDEVAKFSDEHRDRLDEKAAASSPAEALLIDAHCQQLQRRFEDARDMLVASYNAYFVPQLRAAVHRTCSMAGRSCSNMLRSDDWAATLQAPTHLYECAFDEVHPAVLPLLRQQQADAAAAVAAAAAAAGTSQAGGAALGGGGPAVSSVAVFAPAAAADAAAPVASNESIAGKSEGVLAPPPSA